MSARKLIKGIAIYLVVVNTIALALIFTQFVYSTMSPSVKNYRLFVLEQMQGDVRRYNNFITTDDYTRLMHATSVDSIRFYYTQYTHSQ